MSNEEDILDSIKSSVAALKFKLERQEALEKLSEIDMTIPRLSETKAGSKLTDVFRSSRFEQKARELYDMWIARADSDLKEHWDELKYTFLTKDQLAQLDRAQTRYNKKHGIISAGGKKSSAATGAPAARAENPYQKVYQRYNPSAAGPSTSSATGASTSSSSSFYSAPLPSPYGTASSAIDPDSNFVAYNYSTVAIKRPRGRPRTNFSVKGEGGRKRGRPPTKRY